MKSIQRTLRQIQAKFRTENKGEVFLIVTDSLKMRGYLHNSKLRTYQYRYILGNTVIIYYLLIYKDIFLNGECLPTFSSSGPHRNAMKLIVQITFFLYYLVTASYKRISMTESAHK